MGRVWWCQAGDLVPWSWDVWTEHNSQHLVDPYSLSHVEHGIGLFLFLTLVAREKLSVHSRTLIVAVIEAIWEVAENTPAMINRYREVTISLDYFGDSILNSVSDYAMCLLGVLLARKTTWQVGVGVFVVLELISVLWIRDSLLLKILMLISPIEAIKQWQAG
ncbi:MAG: DUF2585 family protein [Pirellulaceae bacterium]|nr:DUF2585 family protein [Pirellulaceae bacterium]